MQEGIGSAIIDGCGMSCLDWRWRCNRLTAHCGGRMKFWIPWGIAATVTAVVVYFFLVGLADGSISSFNAGLWTLLLLGTLAITVGSLILKNCGRPGLGAILSLVLVLPGLLAGLFGLVILITQPRWN